MKFLLNNKTVELAGLIAGDGYLHKSCNRIIVTGSLDDLYYYENYIIPIFIKSFNITPKLYKRKGKNAYDLQIENKNVFSFFVNELGMIRGSKKNRVLIPDKIIKNKEFSKNFIRGLFDTDGCLKFSKQTKNFNYYPRIQIYCHKSPMCDQIRLVLDRLKFNYSLYKNKSKGNVFVYELSGFLNLEKWSNIIGSSNPVNISKFIFIKKKGFYQPYLTLIERLNILNLSIKNILKEKLFK